MTPEQLGITAQQYANIEQLTSYCERLTEPPVRFDMAFFCSDADRGFLDPEQWGCGTVACFAGLGPAAGIGPFGYTDWGSYIYNSFAEGEPARAWLFDGSWASVDNTLAGACARARRFLDRGVPKGFDPRLPATWTPWKEGWQNGNT